MLTPEGEGARLARWSRSMEAAALDEEGDPPRGAIPSSHACATQNQRVEGASKSCSTTLAVCE